MFVHFYTFGTISDIVWPHLYVQKNIFMMTEDFSLGNMVSYIRTVMFSRSRLTDTFFLLFEIVQFYFRQNTRIELILFRSPDIVSYNNIQKTITNTINIYIYVTDGLCS